MRRGGIEDAMNISVPLSSEAEAKLREQAQAAGKDIATFVQETLEEKLAMESAAGNGQEDVPANQWIARLRHWAASHRALPYEADDSRASIYEGRGE